MKRLMFLVMATVMMAMLLMPTMAAAADPICLKINYNPIANAFERDNGAYNFYVVDTKDAEDKITQTQLFDSSTNALIMTITFTGWNEDDQPTSFNFNANYLVLGLLIHSDSCGTQVNKSDVGLEGGGTIYVIQESYSPNGTMADINLQTCMNDQGKYHAISFIRFCFKSDDGTHLFPEVSTIALMSIGLLALGGFVVLRRRATQTA